MLEAFLIKNGLIERETGNRLKRFCWCSDGPWDIRDFLVKQCFISQVSDGRRCAAPLADVCANRLKCQNGSEAMSWMYDPQSNSGR
jgi:hypothetical protein